MQITLEFGSIGRFPEVAFQRDESRDDIRSILGDICDGLAETSAAGFVVAGFGQEPWPVDVRTDLLVLLEQLPGAITAAASRSAFAIDFYEQGLQRVVHFKPEGEKYSARCESGTDWKPSPGVEVMDALELTRMLQGVLASFMRFLSASAPRVAAHPWVVDWANGVG